MKDVLNCAAAMLAGAAAMYYLDPDQGRRRRALVKDKIIAKRHDVERYARTSTYQASNRIRGAAAEAKADAGLTPAPETDHQMVERVRAEMGRLVSHPGAIDVFASEGRVCLGGHILTGERHGLVSAISAMKDVEAVDDQMQAYDQPGNVSELQG